MFGLFGNKSGKNLTQAAKEAAENPAIKVVDVRSPEEFRMGHVPGAINLPVDNLQAAPRLLADKGAELYLYCASGARSAMAASMLKRMGYTNCHNAGGVGAYEGKLAR